MEPVGDLFRLRSALPGSLGAKTAAISADRFHLGVSFQPVGAGDLITILEKIDDRATLKVDNDRAVSLRLPPAPVVDPNNRRRLAVICARFLICLSTVSSLTPRPKGFKSRSAGRPPVACSR
jgi:hypothetical protein